MGFWHKCRRWENRNCLAPPFIKLAQELCQLEERLLGDWHGNVE